MPSNAHNTTQEDQAQEAAIMHEVVARHNDLSSATLALIPPEVAVHANLLHTLGTRPELLIDRLAAIADQINDTNPIMNAWNMACFLTANQQNGFDLPTLRREAAVLFFASSALPGWGAVAAVEADEECIDQIEQQLSNCTTALELKAQIRNQFVLVERTLIESCRPASGDLQCQEESAQESQEVCLLVRQAVQQGNVQQIQRLLNAHQTHIDQELVGLAKAKIKSVKATLKKRAQRQKKKKQQQRAQGKEEEEGADKLRPLDDHMLCVICLDEPKIYAVEPCFHLCLCEACVESLALPHAHGTSKLKAPSGIVCPICRQGAQSARRVYL